MLHHPLAQFSDESLMCAGALGRLQGWLSGGAAQRDRLNADLTPAQRELLAATRREDRLDELLGPAPDPPQAPRGQTRFCSPASLHWLRHLPHPASTTLSPPVNQGLAQPLPERGFFTSTAVTSKSRVC